METTKNLMKSNAGIGGWTGHTCQSEPLISVISQKPTNRWIAMIRQSNHWMPLYFAFCSSSNEFVCYDSILGIQSLHAQERFWNFTHLFWLYSLIHHFVDYVMSRFGRQGSAFVTDDFDLHSALSKPWLWYKTLPAGPFPAGRLSGSRINLVSRLKRPPSFSNKFHF